MAWVPAGTNLDGARSGRPRLSAHGVAGVGADALPSKECPCKTVKVHVCDAKSDGKLYNCRDESETECTIISGPGSGKGPVKVN